MEIRRARPDEAMAVARVHVRSWQAGYRGILADDVLDGLRPEDRAARYTFDRTGPDDPATFVAVEGGAIVGFATLGPSRDPDEGDTGELYALYIDPDAWGSGAGRALMARARQRFAELGRRRAVLWVLRGNVRAERFYRADGWQPDGVEQREEVWGVEVDEIRYAVDLDQTG